MDGLQLVKDKIRSIKDFPIEGIVFRDITTAVKDKDALKEMIDFLTNKFKNHYTHNSQIKQRIKFSTSFKI